MSNVDEQTSLCIDVLVEHVVETSFNSLLGLLDHTLLCHSTNIIVDVDLLWSDDGSKVYF